MPFDIQTLETIIKALMASMFGMGLYVYTNDKKRTDDLEKEFTTFKIHVAEHYVKNEDLERIYKKLDDIDRHLRGNRNANEE